MLTCNDILYEELVHYLLDLMEEILSSSSGRDLILETKGQKVG